MKKEFILMEEKINIEVDESRNWHAIYSINVNTVWGQLNPDPKMKQIILDIIKTFPKKTINVLDIGCGNGRNSKIFKDMSAKHLKYFGIDFARAAIDYCKTTHSNGKFIQKDITKKLDLPIKSFDLIMDYGCFHSIDPDHRGKYIENILKISVKGTYLVIGAWYGAERPAGITPDFQPYKILKEWFVNISDIESFFKNQYRLVHNFLDNSPPHDIHNGMMYFVLTRD